MKPHPALTPLAGFNVRGVPVRCLNHAPGVNVPATKVFGYRRYCPSCASFLATKPGGDSVQRDEVSVRPTGGGIALLVEP